MEIRVSPSPENHWIQEARRRWNLEIRLRACQPAGGKGSRLLQLLEIGVPTEDAAGFEQFLRARREVKELSIVSTSPTQALLRVVTPMPELCATVFEEGAICANCRFLQASEELPTMEWTLLVPPGAHLRRFSRAVERARPEAVPWLRVRRYSPPRDLTPRQLLALSTAHRLGFYAFPRRVRLRDVAKELGISRPAIAELLRRAESKVLSAGLEELREGRVRPSAPSG